MSDTFQPLPPKGDAQAIIDATAASVGITSISKSGMPTVILPPGYKVETHEGVLLAPIRKRGVVTLHSAESFIDYVTAHGAPGSIYANNSNSYFVAVLNDHQSTDPGWGDYRASYSCPLSRQWTTWAQHDGQSKAQVAFAQFIEDNLADIMAIETTDPSAAEMLEIATNLQARSESNFTSAIRLDNGDINFGYREQTDASTPGQMRVPDHFSLFIPIYQFAAPAIITARLRYRIKEGRLTMWYSLQRPEEKLDAAFMKVADRIKAACSASAFYFGSPRP